MTIISAELFEALKKAGVPSELAKNASKEVAEATKKVLEQDNKLAHIEAKINILNVKINLLMGLGVAILVALLIK